MTASLDFASGADTRVDISATGSSAHYSLTSNKRLTINDGSTSSTGTVRITGACPSPGDRTITVSGSATNSEGVTGPDDVEVTISCPYPEVELSVSSSTIGAGESATITAGLDFASGADTRVDISATGSSAHYSLTSNKRLTINDGSTSSTGTVRITGACPSPGDRTITVSGSATNSEGVTGPDDVEVTISCPYPEVELSVSRTTLADGESATITAGLDFASGADTRVDISATGSSAHYSLTSNKRLTINDGSTSSTGTVRITGACPSPGDRTITVSGSATNSEGVTGPDDVEVTISCPYPEVELSVSSSTIGAGESATITAGLDFASGADTRVDISASGSSAHYSLTSNKRLTINDGSTSSTGTVRITGACPSPGDRTITVSGSATNSEGVTGPDDVEVTISCPYPEVELSVSRTTLADGESATITAGLDFASGADTRVDISATGSSAHYSLTSNKRLTINDGSTSSTGTVRITGACPSPGDRTITVSGSATNSEGVTGPDDVEVTISCPYPEVELSVSRTTLADGESATITAGLDFASGADTRVDISATGSSAHYSLTSNKRLTINDGSTSSTGTVRITGACPSPGDRTITVSGSATNSEGVTGPDDVEVTISCPYPEVELSVSSSTIGAGESATITAGLDFASGADTRVDISASGSSAHYSLTSNKRLTINDGSTSSTGTVRITGACPSPGDRTITVSGSATNSEGVTGPDDVEVTISCPYPEVELSVSRTTLADGESATITAGLDFASGADTRVDISATGSSAHYSLTSNKRLTINDGSTSSTGTVRITGACPSPGDRTITVSGSATNSEGVTGPDDVEVTISCPYPEVELSVSSSTIGAGESATITAGLDFASGADTRVDISASGSSAHYSLTSNKRLTINDGSTSSTGTVRITGACPSPGDRTITVSGSATNSEGVTGPDDVEVTISCPSDTTAPMYWEASVNGSTLQMWYDEDLDTDAPDKGAFTVTASRSSPAVSAVAISGRIVTLTLSPAVQHGETVTLSYTAPQSDPLQDLAGNDAVDLTDEAVTNNTPDTTAPVLSSAAVNGASLVLTYNESLKSKSSLSTSLFTVNVAGSARGVSSASASGTSVTLTLSSAVEHGESVTVSYSGTNAIEDEAGNDAAALSNRSVTNNTPDTTAPMYWEASVNGSTLQMWYDEDLDTDAPDKGAFTVTASRSSPAVSAVAISGRIVTLTLSPAVQHGETVTLSYTAPQSDPLQDLAGNDAVDLTDEAVTNNTPAPDVTVSFDAANYDAAESGDSALVTVTLNADPEREVEILLEGTPQGGATAQGEPGADYSGIPDKVTFNPGITVQTFTVMATDDSIDDDGESVDLSFGDLPDGVTQGVQITVSVALTDNEVEPTVTLSLSPESISEDGGVSTITADLSHASSSVTTVTVSSAAVSPAVARDLTQSGATLTIAAESLSSTGDGDGDGGGQLRPRAGQEGDGFGYGDQYTGLGRGPGGRNAHDRRGRSGGYRRAVFGHVHGFGERRVGRSDGAIERR